MIRYLLLLHLILAVSYLNGQDTVDVFTFFADRPGYLTDSLLPPALEPPRTPLIRAYDLRTESRDFEAGRQEYVLRLNFSTPGLGRAQRALYRHQADRPQFTREKISCEDLEDRYRDWSRMFFLDRRRELRDSLLLIVADRQRLAERYIASLRVDPDRLFDIRTTTTELTLEIDEDDGEMRQLRRQYALGDRPLSFERFPRPTDLEITGTQSAVAAAIDEELTYDLGLIDREIELERAEGKQLLDFLQFQYQSNNNEILREKFSIGLALRIQDSGNRKLKIRELELERERLRQDGNITGQIQKGKIAVERARLEEARRHYLYIDSVLTSEDEDLGAMSAAVARRAGQDPDLRLNILERRLKNRLRRLRAYERLIEAYLDWREQRGELCRSTAGQLLATE